MGGLGEESQMVGVDRALAGELLLETAHASLQTVERGNRSLELGHPTAEGLLIGLELTLPTLLSGHLGWSNSRRRRTENSAPGCRHFAPPCWICGALVA